MLTKHAPYMHGQFDTGKHTSDEHGKNAEYGNFCRKHGEMIVPKGRVLSPAQAYCSSRGLYASAPGVSCDYRSSRQRTRSSTAHRFCTTARLRGLNGEPCR